MSWRQPSFRVLAGSLAIFSRIVVQSVRSLGIVFLGAVLATNAAIAQEVPAAPSNPLLFLDTEHVRVQGKLAVLLGVFGSTGTWYGLDTITPGSTYKQSKGWGEGWFAPGIEVALRPVSALEIFGGFSVGLSGTLGVDPFDQKDQGAVLIETAYGGLRTRYGRDEFNVELSFGQQPYGIGTGMIVWQGAANGFEHGALSLLPRISWETAALARVTHGGLKVEAFYLAPNELPSAYTGTRLAGGVLEYAWGQGSRVGAAYVTVPQSTAPYPIPTFPLLIPDGRQGLQTWHAYSRIEGSPVGLPTAWVRGEVALQRNNRISMYANAWYAEIGNRFAGLPMAPTLSYGYASFSGDNPSTAAYERFDPLFYGNGLDNWWFGASSAYAFLNSNVTYHRVTLDLVGSPQDFLKLQYINTRANQLNSPIQFGQGAQFSVVNGSLVLTTGVAYPDLADEIYAAWTHVWTPQLTTTLWSSVGFPGQGIRSLPGIRAETWLSTGFVTSVRF